MRYLISALSDLAEWLKVIGSHRSSFTMRRANPCILLGYQGLSIIAVSGLDMAAWDALAKAAGMPLCVLLGGSIGAVKAYNSNGLCTVRWQAK